MTKPEHISIIFLTITAFIAVTSLIRGELARSEWGSVCVVDNKHLPNPKQVCNAMYTTEKKK